MKMFTAVLVGFLAVLVVAAPVSAHHRPGHDGGPPEGSKSHANNKQNKGDDEKNSGQGLHLGRSLQNLTDGQADKLADEFKDCTDTGDLRDMKLGQIMRLSHAAGIGNAQLKDLLSSDDGPGRGLGRLIRNGISSDEAEDLRNALREGLESGDLDDLPVGKLMQAAKACDLSPHELADLLD
jgi:hypothetical protein